MDRKIVVIAGGGFGGIRAALDLEKRLPQATIYLINNSPYHCFTPDLYEIVSVKIGNTKEDFNKLRQTVNLSLQEIFNGKNVSVLVETIKEVNLVNHEVETFSQKIKYDYLILSLGSITNYYGIEGAPKFSHPLKDTESALNIRNELSEFVEKKPGLKVVVAGGGFTGVEVAGELTHFLPKQSKVILVEALDNILTGMPKWLQNQAVARLEKLGVQVLTSQPIKKITDKEIICKDKKLPYDYLISTTGVKGNNLNGFIKGAAFNHKGQIPVTKFLNLESDEKVFVVGDLSEFINQKTSKPTPPAAWAAIGQASVAASNISAIEKKRKLKKYNPPYPAFVVPIGGKYAMTNLFGLEITGAYVWGLKQLITLRYFLSILPISRALRFWWRGVTTFIRNDS